MKSSWQILFTAQFKRDIDNAPLAVGNRILDRLSAHLANPYANNPNAKPLKGMNHVFRLRVGKWRAVYRVFSEVNKVFLLRTAQRKSVYANLVEDDRMAGIGPIEDLVTDLPCENITSIWNDEPEGNSGLYKGSDSELNQHPDVVESLLDEEELGLLGVPSKWHKTILLCSSLGDLKNGVPEDIRQRVEDYLTSPGQSHIGKLYELENSGALHSIRGQSLGDFLVALDSNQQNIVERCVGSIDSGPIMLRGGPGTGKTLVCLNVIAHLIRARKVELPLLSTSAPVYSFFSYTNSIVEANKALLRKVLPRSIGVDVSFQTVDKLIYSIAEKACGKEGLPKVQGDVGLLRGVLVPILKSSQINFKEKQVASSFLSRYSPDFVLEEFESIINGNGISSKEEYLGFQRKGRKTPLQKRQRDFVWSVFESFQEKMKCKEPQAWVTWGAFRNYILSELDAGKIEVRKSDVVIVDELQDLSATAIKILVHIAKDPRFMLLSSDSGQSIYNKAPSWHKVSSKLIFHKGNSFILERSYRMTKEISAAVANLRNDPDDDKAVLGMGESIFNGPKPHWVKLPLSEHLEALDLIISSIKKKAVNLGQVGIILRTNSLVSQVDVALRKLSISTNKVDRDNSIDVESDAVHIMTAHNSKGFEFPFLIVPFVGEGIFPFSKVTQLCNDENARQEALDQEERLFYVALSRASRELWMIVDEDKPSIFVNKLEPAQWNFDL